ncbi:MAG: zinc ribbon domain-containing protein [Bacteroidales bacterium]|nr:zinc ribbon domain-containing protein [Bacteroidales bacterium]
MISFLKYSNSKVIENRFNDIEQGRREIQNKIVKYLENNTDRFKNIRIEKDHIYFDNHTLFRLVFFLIGIKHFQIHVETCDGKIKINYSVRYGILLFLLIFPLISVVYRDIMPLIFFIILSFYFVYYAGILRIDNIVSDALQYDDNPNDETEELIESTNTEYDYNKCPACGNQINKNDKECSDCGLSLK